MNVVIPHAVHYDGRFNWKLEAAVSALLSDDINPKLYACTGDFDLYELWLRLWAEAETVVMVEHDIVVWPGAIRQLFDCPDPWCAYPYKIGGFLSPAHGCVKYEGSFMAEFPGVIREMAEGNGKHYKAKGDPRYWAGMDSRISLTLSALTGRGFPHRHEPPVTHLNQDHWREGGNTVPPWKKEHIK